VLRYAAEWSPATRTEAAVVTIASALIGGAAGCAPVGSAPVDHLLTGGAAAAVTLAAANASGAALVVASAVVVAAGGSWELHVAGVAALVATIFLERLPRPRPAARAVVGAVIVQSLLRLPWTSPTRGSAVVAFVVMALVIASGVRRTPTRARRVVFVAGCALGVVVLLATLASAFSVLRSRTLLESGEAAARAGVDAARNGDRAGAVQQFGIAESHFDDAQHRIGSWLTWPARQLPLVGPQLRTLDTVAGLGARTIPIARSAATNIDPDRLRLENGRLNLETLSSYRPIFDQLANETRVVRARLDRLPRMWLVPPLDDQLGRFATTVARADDSARTADEAVRLAPDLLGASGKRTYLVAFVTPAEARGSGGLMANFGVLTAANGRIRLDGVGRGPDLDDAGRQPKHITGPADYLARYAKFEPAQTWENVTMSPDFPSVGDVMAQLYPQSGGVPIAGVIQVDPFAMAQLLTLTGPVTVPGLPITIDADNAVSFLLRDEYTIITDPIRRSNLLGDVAKAVFQKLTTGQSAQPSELAQVLSPLLDTKDLALWMKAPAEQAFVRDIGADDALPPVRGDSFGVIVQNGGGSKIDDYLQRTIRYSSTVSAATGRVTSHAVIALHNGSPASGVPLYVIGNELGKPPGTSILYVSLYSSMKLTGATLDGKPALLVAETELGRHVYSSFVDIPPGGTRTFSLDFAGSVDLSAGDYHFDYLPQVLPNPDRVVWSARIEGAEVTHADGHGAGSVTVGRTARSASVTRSGERGPWSVDLALRR
jgi:hypothetical protein